MQLKNLDIIEPIQKALKTQGYTTATPIQEMAIPQLLEGKDLLGCAQTGTGKTAAFAVPILQGLSSQMKHLKGKRKIKALVLAPTRELAIQIGESFKTYGENLDLKTLVIFGGVPQNPQTKALGIGIDILVATPGRLLDLINQKYVHLDNIEYFVLDEADYMLDMGMIHDVRRIIKFIPKVRQTMFFSATMPTEISKLADQLLTDPVKVAITPVSSAVEIIEQAVYYVNKSNKTRLLVHLLKNEDIISALVFSRTKHGANKIVKLLEKAGINAEAIHGNKSQNKRQLALKNFKDKKTRVLVATDIAARGIDVDELSHVINYNLPEVPETYVHRIGRTGRAGLGGIAISFCDQEEKSLLKEIEKLTSKKVPVVSDHPYPLVEMPIELKEVPTHKYSESKTKSNHKRNKSSSSQKNNNQRKRVSN
ncbi:MAG: DEAD/DEAH box helicase [Clostridiales bacterium]|nr:DEAD/DEAH box helicase [Clostridiales bacterium]